MPDKVQVKEFPFLFGGTFIEGVLGIPECPGEVPNFPSFSEGLSLRGYDRKSKWVVLHTISLPFRRDFH